MIGIRWISGSLVAILVVTCALFAMTSCGGSSVPNGPAIEIVEAGDCDVERYSAPPSDQGQTPPAQAVEPGDTPQPGCPEVE